jgi:hypothetical protein
MGDLESGVTLKWNEEEFHRLLNTFDIPEEAEASYPAPDSTGDNPPDGKITIWVHSVVYGHLRLPFTRFFVSLLSYYGIHPNRLHPFGVIRAKHFEYCCLALRRIPTVESFNVLFQAVPHGDDFTFSQRRGSPILMKGVPSSLRNYKRCFFYVTDRVLPSTLTRNVVLRVDDPPSENAFRSDPTCRALLAQVAPYQTIPEPALVAVGMSRKWIYVNHSPLFLDPVSREGKFLLFVITC